MDCRRLVTLLCDDRADAPIPGIAASGELLVGATAKKVDTSSG